LGTPYNGTGKEFNTISGLPDKSHLKSRAIVQTTTYEDETHSVALSPKIYELNDNY